MLDHLARLGCDPAAPREIASLPLPPASGPTPTRSRTRSTRDGWSTAVEQSEGAWLVVATRSRALDVELVHETRARLAALAAEHGGLYDGWEAPTA